MNDKELRLKGLQLALDYWAHNPRTPIDELLKTAQIFEHHINGTSIVAHPLEASIFEIAARRLAVQDPVRFSDYIRLSTPGEVIAPIQLYPEQIACLNAFNSDQNTIVCAARQSGKTTAEIIFALWFAMSRSGAEILLVGPNYAGSSAILSTLVEMYERLPTEIRSNITNTSKNCVAFDNGSKILARAVSPFAIRGLRLDLIIVDEAAWISHNASMDFYTSLRPIIATGGKLIVSSTPSSSYGGMFCSIWDNPELDWNKLHLPSHHSAEWDQERIAQIGQAAFDQCYRCILPPRA